MDSETKELTLNFLQMAKTALTGRPQDVQLLIHRATKKFKNSFPEMTSELVNLLQESPTRTTPLRKHADVPLPVDLDSRLQLLRLEHSSADQRPILSDPLTVQLEQILSERKNVKVLQKHGLQPTKSLLLTGPPGVGKTMTARWIAAMLRRPLLVLDLAAVMSSFLGRTGNNIRFVLDYAKNTECVLLLDELDAIAKRRDDTGEIGELKRLVTVLLQEIDDWPSTGLLIAATNHSELLDPAIWRRFDVVLKFDNPQISEREQLISGLLDGHVSEATLWGKILAHVFDGLSSNDIERRLNVLRKSAALGNEPLMDKLEQLIVKADDLSREKRIDLACALTESGLVSQRRAQEITGVARETIRKNLTKIK